MLFFYDSFRIRYIPIHNINVTHTNEPEKTGLSLTRPLSNLLDSIFFEYSWFYKRSSAYSNTGYYYCILCHSLLFIIIIVIIIFFTFRNRKPLKVLLIINRETFEWRINIVRNIANVICIYYYVGIYLYKKI